MKAISLTLFISIALITNAFSQAQILQKALDKIGAIKNVTYNSKSISTNPFSGGIDTSTYSAGFFNRAADGRFASYYIDYNNASGQYKYIYHDQKLVSIDMQQSNYRFEPDYTSGSYYSSVFAVADNLKGYLNNKKISITRLTDSAVNKVLCAHLYFATIDTSNNSYIKHHVYISKADNLIMYSKRAQQGEMTKGDMSLGVFKMNDSQYFTDYVLDAKEPAADAFTIPAGFTEEKKKVDIKPGLQKGTTAPDWQLTSTDGESLSLAKLKGKVVLIDFTVISCAPCMLAVKALKNLHQKYKDSDVEIVTINLSDKRDVIAKFRKVNSITTPIYTNGKQTAEAYLTYGVPNFYIINKKGEVSEYYDGFFENFEKIVSGRIEEVRGDR
ncbi:MAG: TlpA family protein disulfide reductase [Sphingobacteriaceae bacterium]|nr:MAG: TlpA family protein disulfide reductase [Sphingobacteriaceae bacterium]